MNPPVRRLYLAGPMVGYAEHNFPLFNRVAKQLRAQGYDVFNPAENDDGGIRRSRAFYMRLDIPALMTCDGVVVLSGWEQSRGASLEVWIALDLDIPIFSYGSVDGTLELRRLDSIGPPVLPFTREVVGAAKEDES